MTVELGIYLRFLQSQIQRDRREERLANHSGNASSNSSPLKSHIHSDSRAVRCCSSWGTLFSLSHPHIHSDSRAVRCCSSWGTLISLSHPHIHSLSREPLKLRCWIEFKTPAGKASSFSE